MKRETPLLSSHWLWLAVATMFAAQANSQTRLASGSEATNSKPIPMDQLGAVATKHYQGDGLTVAATAEGARLRCVFQRLEGQVTSEGLWLTSAAEHASGKRFRVVAVAVGRDAGERSAAVCEASAAAFVDSLTACGWVSDHSRAPLATTGVVQAAVNLARFIRDGLTEEYSVSMDGVRQDFIIQERPEDEGELRVELDVTGAKAEPLVNGARLVLGGSGRKLAYNRLRVVDARGQELTARLEVTDATRLTLVVDDAAAIYPVRIDPTFSDADWSALGSGINIEVVSLAMSGMDLYVGGRFNMVNSIAKWDGSVWSSLGSGINDRVSALAVSGTNLYAGGNFTTAGGTAANYIAKWNGSGWSALGLGMSGPVLALAVSGTDQFAGGVFTTAGGTAANYIAKWNGSSWTALGAGMNDWVTALTVSGGDVYVGGRFTTAGGNAANSVANWNGSSWTALGSGMNVFSTVYAMAVSGSNVYAGGDFTTAGGSAANRIAKWNGNSWAALGAGMNSTVFALAVSGSDVYAAGSFTTAGGTVANRIAKWDGNGWSPLGSGMNDFVNALVISHTNLFAGGFFTTAGNKVAAYVAKANIGASRGRFSNLVYSPATGFSCTFLDASTGQPYRIQTSPSLADGTWTDLTNFIYTAPVVITDASAGSISNQFFRAITP